MSKSRSRPRNESIPVYGLDKELKDKADAKYDHAMEAEVKTWIEAVVCDSHQKHTFNYQSIWGVKQGEG